MSLGNGTLDLRLIPLIYIFDGLEIAVKREVMFYG